VERTILAVERALARRTDALVAVSDRVRDDLVALRVGRPEQWRVIPIVYELAGFATATLPRPEARRLLRIPPEGQVVGIVGRLVRVKDHDTLFAAARAILKTRSDVRFVVAGDGPLRVSLEGSAKRALGNRVQFLGWVQNLVALYRALDVIALTSRNEGTPAALIEAAACSVPAVATDVGGVSEVVLDGRTGFLVPPGESDMVAQRLLMLLSNSELRQEFGSAARDHVLERFDAGRAADAHDALYRELLSNRASRTS
jgi:glycosyltransferase involved in cell wall biosynthesis